MNRTEKNSLIGSSVLHGLVVGVLLLSSFGFMSKQEDMVSVQFVEAIPQEVLDKILTDGETRGGAGPAASEAPPSVQPAAPPVAAQVQPPPQPRPEPQPRPVQPEPTPVAPVQPRTETRPQPKAEPAEEKTQPAPTPDRNSRVIDLNNKTTSKKPDPKPEPKPVAKPERKIDLTAKVKVGDQEVRDQRARNEQIAAQREANERAAAARRQLTEGIQGAIRGVTTGTGRPVAGLQISGGGGGEAALNYGQYIVAEFKRVWIVPSTATTSMLAKATVTVASDGRITEARLIGRSGNSAFDASVESALKKVRKVSGFPAGATDQSRTYTIHFQPRSSQGTG